MKEFKFNDLFIFDLANNHQGDLRHGLDIINAVGDVVRKTGVRGALKLQFRNLDTFIHPDYKGRSDVPHIPRFMGTALERSGYEALVNEVRKNGMTTICTPFDEESVNLITEMGIEVIKVASCSNKDRPLLERIAEAGKPVVISTAGMSLGDMDRLVNFMEHKGVNFALMHCVALYPTPVERLNLNQIELLRNRYPDVTAGFSTHEDPDNYSAIGLAYAKGARIFERHVGIETAKYKLNAYSSRPEQVHKWIRAWQDSKEMCGGEHRPPSCIEETASLNSLKRGAYAKKEIKGGERIGRDAVFFAMPLLDGQLFSGEWREELVADRDYGRNEPLDSVLADAEPPRDELIYQIILQVKGMLRSARVHIGKDSSVEISHHYGLERFREFGAVIIDCINRDYCKKLMVMLPRQKHPYHCHRKKEETFQLLHGDLEIELEGKRSRLNPGDTFLVKQGEWHKFHTLNGAIFEEISTTHFNDDSFYDDERVTKMPRELRKTFIPNWEAAVSDKF